MSPELLDPRTDSTVEEGEILTQENLKRQLAGHFYIKHNFATSSCRMDALATVLFQENPSDIEKPQLIMKAIANFLDDSNNRALFEPKIQQEGLTIEDVQRQYREEGETLFETDLEIELAAHALGISIGIFAPGLPVTQNASGLIEPTLFLGPTPETKERFYLAFNGVNSFYALEPRLKVPAVARDELSEAITTYLPFWKDALDDEVRTFLPFLNILFGGLFGNDPGNGVQVTIFFGLPQQ